MLTRYDARAAALVAALLTTVACSDDYVSGPGTPELETVALVELQDTRPAFYIQKSDGSARRRIHFTGAIDQVPDNSPLVPDLTDENILAIRSVKWSPDGSRIAFVATVAHDQAEVVVMKADGTDARVVSVNFAYIVGDVDWSADGTRLTYVMATQPSARGLEVFVSDMLDGVPRVTKVTTNSGYRGLGGTIRFASTGNAVWISQVTDEQGPPLFESVGAVRRVDLATGGITSVREGIVGEVQAVAHDGTYAIVLRRKAITNGVYDSQIVRVPLGASGAEQLLVDGGRLDYARLTTDDRRVLLLRDGAAFTAFDPLGGRVVSLRGSGAEPLSADLRP